MTIIKGFSAILLIIFATHEINSKSISTNIDTISQFEVIDTCYNTNKKNHEEFDLFFVNFQKDITFQNQRILYPLQGEIGGPFVVDNYNKLEEPQNDKELFIEQIWNSNDDIGKMFRINLEEMGFEKQILFHKKDSVEVRLIIPDSGTIDKFIFRTMNGLFYLTFYGTYCF